MTEGYRYVSAGTGSLFVLLTPVLNCIVGAVFFGERLSPRALLGSSLVIGSCFMLALSGLRKRAARHAAGMFKAAGEAGDGTDCGHYTEQSMR